MQRVGAGVPIESNSTLVKTSRELMSEFNKAAADAPNKRKRPDGGIIYENGKEIGESMYQLVTRDTSPGAMHHQQQHHGHDSRAAAEMMENENSMRIESHGANFTHKDGTKEHRGSVRGTADFNE
mmetsp:Transcript_20202/g.27300  ORF Transcript_20202/g.27300 Transcript_20202/m.27300 type:complete len:125 (+) Transcript_20202:1963-2337(+)|eukprot:CAMPEP_0185583544 /NCGR_PEP_ID=MMETSP0434-20130131/25058_1 /TAXON_ID=626734 ORGANISM="Favella taraikaensis, Strain Fe Narragansett Bay" /NCGR_SAMPLE_ID=MMETSP0434 /ASSEMBLY_ACC=CAM_ASM_000379 /LENGTH=124 /DNA_ID=CAMNT_0028202739 /DNA_START=1340 /DNA_END=1714 /DNA_ORIENTATION=-